MSSATCQGSPASDKIADRNCFSQSQLKNPKMKRKINRPKICKLSIDKTLVASILTITLAVAGDSIVPFTQNVSFAAGEIAQTNEPDRTPDGSMVPVNGKVNVKLINQTNDRLFYQVVGQTTRRTLGAKSKIELQELKLPASILFRRQDNGFLKVTLNPGEKGMLDLKLNETTNLDTDKKSLTIRKDGSLFLR
jgi:hypothetical protein